MNYTYNINLGLRWYCFAGVSNLLNWIIPFVIDVILYRGIVWQHHTSLLVFQ